MKRSCLALILAAGEGTRMRSSLPKVMHPVANRPMVLHVLQAALDAECNELAVVAGFGGEHVSKAVLAEHPHASVFEQTQRLGTAHAVLAARPALEQKIDDVIVLFGDTPLLKSETLLKMREALADGSTVVVAGFRPADPAGYGRLIMEGSDLKAIREHKDCSPQELEIGFCNAGLMGFSGGHALELLDKIGNENAKGEYYLTDAVEIANKLDLRVEAIEADADEVIGVNTRSELARVDAIWQQKRRVEVMLNGITMQAPETVYLSADTQIEPDVVIEPNVVFGPGVSVSAGATIKAFSHLEGAQVGKGATIGPYARLRPGADLGEASKVGNFVEIKNAKVASGAKVNHLTYVGDAKIGERANIGAGTITCNYDGMNKHLTKIGADAFIGSNSSLVAPVTIGDGAYIGTGSVITEDVPNDDLALARGRQTNKTGRARLIRERNAKLKAERTAKK